MREHPVQIAILRTLRHPGDDIATGVHAFQPRHRRRRLLIPFIGVALLLAEELGCRGGIGFRRHRNHDILGSASHVRAVAHRDAHGASGVRPFGAVAIHQTLGHPFYPFGRRAGVEGDFQIDAVDAIQRGADGADVGAAVADDAAGHPHLTHAGPFVAYRQLIVGAAGATDELRQQLAAVEGIRAGVIELQRIVNAHAGIGLALGERHRARQIVQDDRACRGETGLNGQLHLMAVADTAIAIAEPETDIAMGRSRRWAGVLIGDVFHQSSHRGGVGAGIEGHCQRGRAHAAAAEAADNHAAIGDVGSRNADLTGGDPLIADAQRFGRRRAIQKLRDKLPGIEIGRIHIAHMDVAVDELRVAGEIRAGDVGQGAQRAQIVENRCGARARELRGVAKKLLGDFVRADARRAGHCVPVGIGDHEVPAAEIGDRRLVFRAVGRGYQFALAVDRRAVGRVFTDVDVRRRPRAADIVIVVVPGDDKAAGRQPRHVGLVLAAEGGFIDLEFAADLGSSSVIALTVDASTIAILVVRTPHHHKTAVTQGGDARFVLITGGGGVDQENVGQRPGSAHRAAVDAINTAVVTRLIGPHDHQVAVRVRRHVGIGLRAHLRRSRRAGNRADPGLGSHLIAGVVEAAQVDVVAVAADVAERGPHHGESAGIARCGTAVLCAAGGGVHHEIGVDRQAVGVVKLADNALAGPVNAAGIVPGHHETTVALGRHAHIRLRRAGNRVDLELVANRHPRMGEPLAIHSGAVAVLTFGIPYRHVTAVAQHRDLRTILRAAPVGIDGLLAMNHQRAVDFQLTDDIDGDGTCLAGAAVAVGDP